MWTSAEHWLHTVEVIADTDAGRLALKEATNGRGMSKQMLLAVARVDAAHADRGTGRNVATSNETAATKVVKLFEEEYRAAGIDKKPSCSVRSVQRARRWMVLVGLALVLDEGRYLDGSEREEAYAAHGRRQTRIASLRALIVPREHAAAAPSQPAAGGVCHPTNSLRVGTSSHVNDYLPTRERVAKKTRSTSCFRPTPELRVFAAGLVQRLPHLGVGHMNGLCQILAKCGIVPGEWTVSDLVTLLDQQNRARGLDSIHSSNQRNPRGLFLAQLRSAVAGVSEAPGARRRREEALREARRAADVRERARVEAERSDPAVTSTKRAIIEDIRAQLASARAARPPKTPEPVVAPGGPAAWRSGLR